MRILIAIDDYFNQSNGMCISTQRFVKQFKQMGYEVRIISRDVNGAPDYPMSKLSIPHFNKLIQKEGFHLARPHKKLIQGAVAWSDIVLIETPFPLCWTVSKIAQQKHKPVIGTFHIYPENITSSVSFLNNHFWNWAFMLYFRQISFKHCDALFCPTAKVKAWLQKHYFKMPLYINSNGIASKFINNPHKERVGQPFIVLCIGRFSHEKQQETLFKALRLCKCQNKIQVILAGQGPLKDKYEKLNQDLDNPVTMKFYSQKDLLNLMTNADLVVHCADVEIEGMACMEAFSAGVVPIIADSSLSSTASYALTPSNKFPAFDSQTLAQRIDYWFTHPDQLKQNRIQYRNFAKNLSVQKLAQREIKIMKQIIQSKKSLNH